MSPCAWRWRFARDNGIILGEERRRGVSNGGISWFSKKRFALHIKIKNRQSLNHLHKVLERRVVSNDNRPPLHVVAFSKKEANCESYSSLAQ